MTSVPPAPTSNPWPARNAIRFPEGLPGWPDAQVWELVSYPDAEPLLWLRCREKHEVAFVVMDPRNMVPDYAPGIPREVRERLRLGDGDAPLVLAVVLLGDRPEDTTVNLRAPILINPRTLEGTQVIL